jgi:hypothetical protein
MKNVLTIAGLVLAASAAPAAAEPLAGDVEIDPTAYVLSGNSLHAGLARDHWRLDLGNFGLTVPQAVHGDDRFDVAFVGYGAKLQWFVRGDRYGWFGGVDTAVSWVHVQRRDSALSATDRQIGAGIHGGYRFALPADLYATLWLGVGYQLGSDDVELDGATFEAQPITVFPAVHLGYRFR